MGIRMKVVLVFTVVLAILALNIRMSEVETRVDQSISETRDGFMQIVSMIPGMDVSESSIKEMMKSAVRVTISDGSGCYISAASGVVVADGLAVTCRHVVKRADPNCTITIEFQDGNRREVLMVGMSSNSDLAVMSFDSKGLDIKIIHGLSKAVVGQSVMVIGNPSWMGMSLSVGVVSGLNRVLSNGFTYTQIDAAVNPGNSGGPVFNRYGRLIGVASNCVSPGRFNVGINLIVPSEIVDQELPTMVMGLKNVK